VLFIAAALGGEPTTTGVTAAAAIPPGYLNLYQQAADACPGLSWQLLAAIGTVESGNGTSTLPGAHSGANPAGAEGPMQFEPATFNQYALPVPPGGAEPPSPYDPVDAIYAAARDLCANGARNRANLDAAVYAYNHSDSYVQQVLTLAAELAATSSTPPVAAAPAAAAAVAVAYAEAQLGTPYQWGGEQAGVAFDCSGLTQAAYQAAGIELPRTAQQQYDAGPPVPASQPLQPGDLVFFGPDPSHVEHVGLLVSQTEMIDAPHTGAAVRVEPYQWPDYLGATRPAT
jgi:cell wall-associated NlpC family hydrolase